jgi:predicted protein tyrosine phosphatase
MTKILFICGKNRRRSFSAEETFSGMDGIEVSSAGTSVEAECRVSADLLEWADRVFVMEQSQRKYLNAHFAHSIKDMQPELVAVLRAKVLPLLRRS